MKLKGFTLAELMTTMAIVGLLATLTVPVIVHNTKRHHQQAMLRKAISTLNQAIAINIAKGRGDLYTYADKEGAAPGVAEYLVQNIDTATNIKILDSAKSEDGVEFWINDSAYFETKDGTKYLFIDGVNGRRCGTRNINSMVHVGATGNHDACPVLIDISKKSVSSYSDKDNITTLCFYKDSDDKNLLYTGGKNHSCENKTPGLYIVYLTNDSVYVPVAIQKFLGDIEE